MEVYHVLFDCSTCRTIEQSNIEQGNTTMYISSEKSIAMDSLVFNSIVIVSYSFLSYTVTLHKLLATTVLTLLYSENQPHGHILPCVVRDHNRMAPPSALIASIVVVHSRLPAYTLDYFIASSTPVTIIPDPSTPIANPDSSKFHISDGEVPYLLIIFCTKLNHSQVFLGSSHKVR